MKPIYCIYCTESSAQDSGSKCTCESMISRDAKPVVCWWMPTTCAKRPRNCMRVEEKCFPWHFLFQRTCRRSGCFRSHNRRSKRRHAGRFQPHRSSPDQWGRHDTVQSIRQLVTRQSRAGCRILKIDVRSGAASHPRSQHGQRMRGMDYTRILIVDGEGTVFDAPETLPFSFIENRDCRGSQ